MRNRSLILILAVLIILSWNSRCLSLNEETHQAINEHTAQNSINGFSLNDYLMNNIGLKDGTQETISGVDANGNNVSQRVFQWLRYGGPQEDRPGSVSDYIQGRPTRSVNHFHNPLRTWDGAGLNDYFVKQWIGQSQVIWAQNPNQSPGGNWSWNDARRYYYIALTSLDLDGSPIAPTQNGRERYFADTFRAIGQLMHLVHDASVPEHVRNNVHVLPGYESYVDNVRRRTPQLWGSWITNPIVCDKSILNIISTDPSASVPISRIIDTDLYTGNNPNTTKMLPNSSQIIGLSEYANANFLSRNTMLTDDLDPNDRHYFPYPRGANTTRWTDGTNNRNYLRKTGDGDAVDHLALVSFLHSYRRRFFPQYNRSLPIGLDDRCYEEYASKLIPRAVGYSAGLLEYFFRGKLDFQQTDTKPNGDIEITITNLSDDSLVKGVFELYYDNDQGMRTKIGLSESVVNNIPNDGTFKTSFTIPVDFNPSERGEYTLVYRGQLGGTEAAGGEKEAVIGRHKLLTLSGILVFYRKDGKIYMALIEKSNDKWTASVIDRLPSAFNLRINYEAATGWRMPYIQKEYVHRGAKIQIVGMPILLDGYDFSQGGSNMTEQEEDREFDLPLYYYDSEISSYMQMEATIYSYDPETGSYVALVKYKPGMKLYFYDSEAGEYYEDNCYYDPTKDEYFDLYYYDPEIADYVYIEGAFEPEPVFAYYLYDPKLGKYLPLEEYQGPAYFSSTPYVFNASENFIYYLDSTSKLRTYTYEGGALNLISSNDVSGIGEISFIDGNGNYNYYTTSPFESSEPQGQFYGNPGGVLSVPPDPLLYLPRFLQRYYRNGSVIAEDRRMTQVSYVCHPDDWVHDSSWPIGQPYPVYYDYTNALNWELEIQKPYFVSPPSGALDLIFDKSTTKAFTTFGHSWNPSLENFYAVGHPWRIWDAGWVNWGISYNSIVFNSARSEKSFLNDLSTDYSLLEHTNEAEFIVTMRGCDYLGECFDSYGVNYLNQGNHFVYNWNAKFDETIIEFPPAKVPGKPYFLRKAVTLNEDYTDMDGSRPSLNPAGWYEIVTPYEVINIGSSGNDFFSPNVWRGFWSSGFEFAQTSRVTFEGIMITDDSQEVTGTILYCDGTRIETVLAELLGITPVDILGVLVDQKGF